MSVNTSHVGLSLSGGLTTPDVIAHNCSTIARQTVCLSVCLSVCDGPCVSLAHADVLSTHTSRVFVWQIKCCSLSLLLQACAFVLRTTQLLSPVSTTRVDGAS